VQSSADFALTYNFQGTHILAASRGNLCDSVASCNCSSRISVVLEVAVCLLLSPRFRCELKTVATPRNATRNRMEISL